MAPINGDIEAAVKQVSSATVKFSNDHILKATGLLRDATSLLRRASNAKQEDFTALLAQLETIKANRSSAAFISHLEAIGAILPAFGLAVLPFPTLQEKTDFTKSCQDSAQFYLNRILKAAKESSDETNLQWVSCMSKLIDALLATFSCGQTCNKGKEASPVPAAAITACTPQAARSAAKTEALYLEGNRWYVQKQNNLSQLITVTPDGINQALAVEDSSKIGIKVAAKINAIILDKCKKVELEIADVVSNVELLSCSNVKIYLKGNVPTLVLDACEAIEVVLTDQSKSVRVFTSKCVEVNVIVAAAAGGGDDYKECKEFSIPAQFVTHLDPQGRLITEPVSHVGA